jgi:hypothetical protein
VVGQHDERGPEQRGQCVELAPRITPPPTAVMPPIRVEARAPAPALSATRAPLTAKMARPPASRSRTAYGRRRQRTSGVWSASSSHRPCNRKTSTAAVTAAASSGHEHPEQVETAPHRDHGPGEREHEDADDVEDGLRRRGVGEHLLILPAPRSPAGCPVVAPAAR